MKKIPTNTLKEVDELRTRLDAVKADYETLLQEATSALQNIATMYNEMITVKHGEAEAIVGDIQTLVADITADMELYYEDRSDSWQEGLRGEAFREWQEAWDSLASEIGDAPEIEVPELELPDDLAEMVDDLDTLIADHQEPPE